MPNILLSPLIITKNFYEGHFFPHFMGEQTEAQRIYDISMEIKRMNELGRLCRKEKKVQRID